jgi:hypothetical protein
VLDTPRTVYDSSQRPYQRDVYVYGFLSVAGCNQPPGSNYFLKELTSRLGNFCQAFFVAFRLALYSAEC